MKKLTILKVIFLLLFSAATFAQTTVNTAYEKHGHNLNIGAGVGYYRYVGSPITVIMLNYEFDVARNFTLAPFVGFYTYTNSYYWGSNNYPYKYYGYRQSVVPLGIKGAYYLDRFLDTGSRWVFYLAGSLGVEIHSVAWDNGYYGDVNAVRRTSPLYLTGHLGARYHFNANVGAFLDLSSGLSTGGISFKL